MPEQSQSFNTWAIVEVMGHKKFAGFVTEQTFGVATLIRVDVPETEQPERRTWQGTTPARTTPAYSKLIGVASIYCITPCTEDVARRAAQFIESGNDPIPVSLPPERQLPASTSDGGSTEEAVLVPDGDDDHGYEPGDDDFEDD